MSVNLSKVPANRFEKLENRIDASLGFQGIVDGNGEIKETFSSNEMHVFFGQLLDRCTTDGLLNKVMLADEIVRVKATLKVSGSVKPYILEVLQRAASHVQNPTDYKRNSMSRYWRSIGAAYNCFMQGRSDGTDIVTPDQIKAAVLTGDLKLKIVVPRALLASDKATAGIVKENTEVVQVAAEATDAK